MKRVNASFYILIFSALSIGLIITALLYKAAPLFTSKTLYLCQKFISDIMFEIPHSFPAALIVIVGIVLGAGLLSFLVQLIKTHIFLKKLLVNKQSLPSNDSDLARILNKLNLTNKQGLSLHDKVILVKDKNLFSFCCGIFSPFIVVSTGLVKSLTDKELEAVLLHEQSHLISRDPIKVLLGKTFSSMFFFLPIFRELHKNIEAANELLADQWTISCQNDAASLRGALKKILSSPQSNIATVSSVSGPDYREAKSLSYFEIRIHRLMNPGERHNFRLSKSSLVTTFLFILISFLLLQTPVSAFPMESMDKSTYFLCSVDQSCSEQCHSGIDQPTNYIPGRLFLPEKTCNDNKEGTSQVMSSPQVSQYQYTTPTH